MFGQATEKVGQNVDKLEEIVQSIFDDLNSDHSSKHQKQIASILDILEEVSEAELGKARH